MFINKDNSIVMNGQVIAESNKREKYCDFIIKNCEQMLHDGSLRPSVRRALPVHPKAGNVYYFEKYIQFKIDLLKHIDYQINIPDNGITYKYYSIRRSPSYKIKQHEIKGPTILKGYDDYNIILRIPIDFPIIIVITQKGEDYNILENYNEFMKHNKVLKLCKKNSIYKGINLQSKQKYYRIVNDKVCWDVPNIVLPKKEIQENYFNDDKFSIKFYRYHSQYVKTKNRYYVNYLKQKYDFINSKFSIDKYNRVCVNGKPLKQKAFKCISQINFKNMYMKFKRPKKNIYYRYVFSNKYRDYINGPLIKYNDDFSNKYVLNKKRGGQIKSIKS